MTESQSLANQLELSEEQMRTLGYRVVDAIVEHTIALKEKPVSRVATRGNLDKVLREPLPRGGTDVEGLIDFVEEEVFAHMMCANHPRFFAFVPGPSNFVSVMADALAAGYNTIVSEWMEASGPAALELNTIDWLRELCGLPAGAGGLFVSGGSVANLTALAVARQEKLSNETADAVIYCSEQTHASNRKATKILGFRTDQLRSVPVDGDWRLDVDALRQLVRDDRAAGRRPFCVIANAGTTNTGAVDPLEALVSLGREEDIWIHVDGAYGGAAVLTERGAVALKGLGQVDSLAIDPHKWLFQPFEIGCVLLRDFNHMKTTFGADHTYLQDVEADALAGEVNFCDVGVQLTRGFRALKLWMSIKAFGIDSFRNAIDYTLDLAEQAEALLADQAHMETCTPARLGVVTFRYVIPGWSEEALNGFNLDLVQAIIADGRVMLSSTRLDTKTVLRLCTINPRTTDHDLTLTMTVLNELAERLLEDRRG